MINITHKSNTLRKAIATAVLEVSAQETIDAIVNKKVPKGDVFEFSRAAGLLAVKKTSDVIPDCHPLPIEYTAISHRIEGSSVVVTVEVHSIYKTGVEVEAMHGAAVTALTIYDMLKPIDKGVTIGTIKLEEKKGGKSDTSLDVDVSCAVLTCSDSVSKGTRDDRSGDLIKEKLAQWNLRAAESAVVPDDVGAIQEQISLWVDSGVKLILITGGTGFSPTDVTPEAILPLIDTLAPGIVETARNYGQQRTPFSMLSRGVAGFIKETLVITMPGSPNGVRETMDAIFPAVLHSFAIRQGGGH